MGEKLRVLIVDDQRDAADALAKLLAALGHETLATYNALDALIEAKAFLPDVAIIDIGMPGFSGYDLAGELAKRQPLTVLVALTGFPVAEVEQHGGFAHILTKPAEMETLRSLLDEISSRRQSA